MTTTNSVELVNKQQKTIFDDWLSENNVEKSDEIFLKDKQQSSLMSSFHTCPRCEKTYAYKKNLLRHLRYECGVQPNEHCFYCSYVTRYKHSLHIHMKSQHDWDTMKVNDLKSTISSTTYKNVNVE